MTTAKEREAASRTKMIEQTQLRMERRTRIIRARNAELPITTIAKNENLTVEQVIAEIRAGLRDALKVPAETLIARQLTQIADMRKALYVQMLQGDQGAIDKLLKVADHEAKLFGLYAPQRVTLGLSTEDFALTAARLMSEINGPLTPAMQAALAADGHKHGVIDAEVTEEQDDEEPWVLE